MNPSVSEFVKEARKLSRNPLGIIALFIVLVYGIAALFLGVNAANLEPYERLPLVLFLVVFPVIVLFVFYKLVVNHHSKLYAPYDFHDDETFIRALSPPEQKQKLEEEVRDLEEDPQADAIVPSPTPEDQVLVEETVGIEILQPITTRQAYIIAEELALRQIESEFGVPVRRHVAILPDYGFDGMFMLRGNTVLVEIKFSRAAASLVRMTGRALERIALVSQTMRRPDVSFLLVLVTDGLTPHQVEAAWERLLETVKSSDMPVEVRLFDLQDLKARFVI